MQHLKPRFEKFSWGACAWTLPLAAAWHSQLAELTVRNVPPPPFLKILDPPLRMVRSKEIAVNLYPNFCVLYFDTLNTITGTIK